jgi:hypothetical protein
MAVSAILGVKKWANYVNYLLMELGNLRFGG